MRRLPVERSDDELVAEVVEAHDLDELVGPVAEPPLGDARRSGRCRARGDRDPRPRAGSVERDADRLVHGERAEEPGVLERPRQAELGAGRGGPTGEVATRRARIRPRVGDEEPRDEVEQRRLARAVGPDDADDLALVELDRHVVDRGDARRSVFVMPRRLERPARHACAVGVAARRVGDRGGARRSALSRRPAAPSRKIERSRSGRSSSSAVRPWKRIAPFSMK